MPLPLSAPEPFSHELKFVFENHRAGIILNWLKARCRVDAEFPAAMVSSIYYDSRNWQSLGEKINSDFLKTKIRLRWYQDLHSGEFSRESFLEEKYKIGAKRRKVRIPTGVAGDRLEKLPLSDPQLRRLLINLKREGITMDQVFLPAFQVTYKRFRLIDPATSARLCVDHDIHSPRVNWQMMPSCIPSPISKGVFECKGVNVELPQILHQLTALGCKKESFSKYGVCHDHHLGLFR